MTALDNHDDNEEAAALLESPSSPPRSDLLLSLAFFAFGTINNAVRSSLNIILYNG